MSLKNIFESIWNYDFSHLIVYLAIIIGILINLAFFLRLAANIIKFKEIKKDFQYFVETIGIPLFLYAEIFIVYKICFDYNYLSVI